MPNSGNSFRHSSVYRVGGDEFVVILEGPDYDQREALLAGFNGRIDKNLVENKVVVSAGMSDYVAGKDTSYKRVFVRADHSMYERKEQLKRINV